ncbi:unnamed protein product [Sphagnum troendelagicum]|uniref:Uncharacterized protein n=1 Tax=Sphagnum troendelagicum TaxID=128251 RepID=A0ABP0UFB3_9BRYO
MWMSDVGLWKPPEEVGFFVVPFNAIVLGLGHMRATGEGFDTLGDDVAMVLLDDGTTLVSRLILDVMGNSSPIVRQIRWGQRPDGVCLVVGTCARGFENNNTSDLIYTRTPVTQVGSNKTQYFWEVRFFPPFFFFNPS